jgi:hypothetical protein
VAEADSRDTRENWMAWKQREKRMKWPQEKTQMRTVHRSGKRLGGLMNRKPVTRRLEPSIEIQNYIQEFKVKTWFGGTIHWNGKNNHFRFSLSLFTFFTLRLFLEKWKSDFFTFQKRE